MHNDGKAEFIVIMVLKKTTTGGALSKESEGPIGTGKKKEKIPQLLRRNRTKKAGKKPADVVTVTVNSVTSLTVA